MRRIVMRLFRIAAVVVVVLFAAYLLRDRLLARPLARIAAWRLSEATAGRFTIERIEGNWFGSIVVVGLRGTMEGVEVRCGRLEAGYSLKRLLFGDRPQDAVDFLRVAGLDLGLDLTAPSSGGEPFDFAVLPNPLPHTTVEGRARVRIEPGTVEAGSVQVEGAGESLAFHLKAVRAPEVGEIASVDGSFARKGRITVQVALLGGRADATVDGPLVEATFDALDLARLDRGVEGTVSGSARLLPGDRIEGTVHVRDLRHEEIRIDRLDAGGGFADGEVRVDSLDARAGDATVAAEDLRIAPQSRTLVTSVKLARAHIPDLRAFLPTLPHAAAVDLEARSADGTTVEIATMHVEGAGTRLDARGSAVLVPADWEATRLDLAAEGVVGDLGLLVEGLPRIAGEIPVRFTVAGTARAPEFHVDAEAKGLVVEGRRVDRLELRADSDGRIARGNVVVAAAPGSAVVSGRMDLASGEVHEGAYEIDIGDLADFLSMIPGAPEASGRLSGTGRFVVDGEGVRGTGTLAARGLVYDGREIGTVDLEVDAARDLVTFSRVEASGAWGHATLGGAVRPGASTARVAFARAEFGGRAGELLSPLDLAWDGTGVAATNEVRLRFAGVEVRGTASMRGHPRADLVVEGVDLALLHPDLAGRAHAHVVIARDRVSVEAESDGLRVRGRDATVRLRVAQQDGGIAIERVALSDGAGLEVSGSGLLPWRVTPEGDLLALPGGKPRVELHVRLADLAAYLPLEGRDAVLDLVAEGDALAGSATVVDLGRGADLSLPGTTSLDLRADAGRASVRFSAPEGGDLSAHGEAILDRGLLWSDLASWNAAVGEARLSGEAVVGIPRIQALARFLPAGWLVEGRCDANVRFAGRPPALDLDGTAAVEGIQIAGAAGLPPLRDGSARLRFLGRRIEIESLRADVGYSPFEASGSVDLAEGRAPSVDLRLKGENVLLARDRHLRLRAHVDLAVKGALDALHAEGSVEVTDALYSRPIDLLAKTVPAADERLQLFSIREGPLSRMTFDIAITGSDSFHIRNNIIRGALTLDLRLQGSGAVPQPVGRIAFRDTLVKLPFSSLKVDQGELRFPPEDPFDPMLRVSAHTRMKGYDLTVATSGPLSSLEVVVTTSPALPQEEGILLLTTGATRDELERTGVTRSALTRIGTFFGERLVSSIGGPQDPDERSLLDRFTFEIGRDISRAGSETIEGEFELKQRWYLRAERDRFDDYNLGVVWRLRFR